jgi:outer membrane protein
MVTMMTRSMNHSARLGLAALTVLGHLAVTSVQPAKAQTPTTTGTGETIQLTMAQAEAMALENNLQLKIDRLDPVLAAEDLAQARAAFNPSLGTSFNRSSSQSSANNAFEGSGTITSTNMNGSTSFSQNLPWFGTNYSFSVSASRSESSRLGATFNPSLGSGLQFNITQPLLQGFKIDGTRNQVKTLERRRTMADVQLDERIVITRVQAQFAYLQLVAARNQRDVAARNLELANQQLKDNQARVEVGTMAPIDIIEAEAEVASREENVIRAEASIAAAEDSLRALILSPTRADYWQVRFEPTEQITLQEREVDVDGAIATALRERTDIVVARSNIEIADDGLRVTRNSTLPTLNLTFRYSASGSGGTQNFFQEGVFPPVIASTSVRGFSSVLGDSFKNNLPTWSVGFQASYPIGKSSAEASLARQQIAREQQDTALRALELRITTSVRTVGRDVQTNFQRVRVTRLARERAERQLDAEQKKFAVGLSSTFTLQQRQRDLATALVNELNATIDYNRSLIEFDAVQKVPIR